MGMELNSIMRELASDVIITAVEGGINYWAYCRDYKWDLDDDSVTRVDVREDSSGSDWETVNVERMAEALERLKPSDNRRLFLAWAHAKCGEGEFDFDAGDADVAMQICVLKEVIYG